MKILFKKIVILLFIIIMLDFSFSKILDLGRPKDYKEFIKSKKDYSNKKDSVEVLFLGDSHTADAIVPSIIKRESNYITFNFGVYHLSPIEGYFLIKDILNKSKNIKLVVLGTNPIMFTRKTSEGKYTPLFINNIFLLNQLYKATNTKNLGVITSTGKKLDLVYPLIRKVIGKNNGKVLRNVTEIDNGYLKNTNYFSKFEDLYCHNNDYNKNQNELQKEYFIKTIELIKNKNVKVVLFNPSLHKYFMKDISQKKAFVEFEEFIYKVAKDYNLEYINKDYEILSGQLNDKDFLNGEHLCYQGAEKFSKELGNYIQAICF